MAETLLSAVEQELLGIKHLLWGTDVKSDIFKRWSQGFYFSSSEKSALEQLEGGPCAIIAPVQAFILKKLLSDYETFSFRDFIDKLDPLQLSIIIATPALAIEDCATALIYLPRPVMGNGVIGYSLSGIIMITDDIQSSTLVHALCEVLQQCNTEKYYIVHLSRNRVLNESCSVMNGDRSQFELNNIELEPSSTTLDCNKFHNELKIQIFSRIADVHKYYTENISNMKAQYGILLFLYSVIATKGLEQVKSESDTNDPLIDETYGYGSQSLINLMITGRAVTYVWDNDQDVGGLKLKGLNKQSQIGFVTLMEHLRYCTVGSFFKNPIHPIWVLGSETHLTVLFSDEKKLVSPETRSEQARRIFKSYDPDGNNFISSILLQDVLSALDLVSDEEYVDIMRKKLDFENLGIILLNAFMDEFFPKEESSTPDMFTLIHYNGLPQSNSNGQIQYHIGSAILLESDLKSICESNPMLTCLQTKWPNIEVNWCDNITPSLN